MLFNYASEAKCQLNMVEFKNMIDKLDESKNICDKDIILGLYYSLYTIMVLPIEMIDKNLAKEYSEYFNKTMNTVIRLSNARKDMVTAESFIGNFFYYLDSGELSKVGPISYLTGIIKEDLDTFISGERKFFNNFLLVDTKFNLNARVAISIQYKNYIGDLYIYMSNIYGMEEVNDMLEHLKDTLDLSLPEILGVSNNMYKFDGEIRSYIKDKLKEISSSDKFDFYSENNQFAYNLIQMLNDDEIKVFKLYYLYKLALFDVVHFATMKITDDKMAFELGMDKDLFRKCFNNIAKKSKRMHLKQSLGFGKVRKKKK